MSAIEADADVCCAAVVLSSSPMGTACVVCGPQRDGPAARGLCHVAASTGGHFLKYRNGHRGRFWNILETCSDAPACRCLRPTWKLKLWPGFMPYSVALYSLQVYDELQQTTARTLEQNVQ